MDPTTTFCPNVACPARGQIGQGHSSSMHVRVDTASVRSVARRSDGQDAPVAGRRGQRAARPAPAPAADQAGEAQCGTSSPVALSRWLGVIQPGHAGALAPSPAHRPGRTAPTASVAPDLARPSRQARCTAPCGRDGPPQGRWPAGTPSLDAGGGDVLGRHGR